MQMPPDDVDGGRHSQLAFGESSVAAVSTTSDVVFEIRTDLLDPRITNKDFAYCI